MHPFEIILESERLFLRQLNLSDLENMFEFTSSKSCVEHLSWHAHESINQTRDFIKKAMSEKEKHDAYTYGIELKEESKLIGTLKIFDINYLNRRAEISYIMNPNYQGKGYMSEAIITLIDFCTTKREINRIQARCTIENKASEKVMIKSGMQFEGILKGFWIKKGLFKDSKLYAYVVKTNNAII